MFYKFTFDTIHTKRCKAEKKNDSYLITSPSGEQFKYHTSIAGVMMRSGEWFNIKEIKEPAPSFSVKEGSIESAARFIVANNSYMQNRSVDYMIGSIKRVIKDMVDKIKNGGEAWYCGTAGYVVMIQQEDEDYYVIEILVDPSVSQDCEFVNVEDVL